MSRPSKILTSKSLAGYKAPRKSSAGSQVLPMLSWEAVLSYPLWLAYSCSLLRMVPLRHTSSLCNCSQEDYTSVNGVASVSFLSSVGKWARASGIFWGTRMLGGYLVSLVHLWKWSQTVLLRPLIHLLSLLTLFQSLGLPHSRAHPQLHPLNFLLTHNIHTRYAWPFHSAHSSPLLWYLSSLSLHIT